MGRALQELTDLLLNTAFVAGVLSLMTVTLVYENLGRVSRGRLDGCPPESPHGRIPHPDFPRL